MSYKINDSFINIEDLDERGASNYSKHKTEDFDNDKNTGLSFESDNQLKNRKSIIKMNS